MFPVFYKLSYLNSTDGSELPFVKENLEMIFFKYDHASGNQTDQINATVCDYKNFPSWAQTDIKNNNRIPLNKTNSGFLLSDNEFPFLLHKH